MIPDKPGKPHTLLDYLSRPPGYKRLLHFFGNRRRGTNLLEYEWDLCLVLDACRADLMHSVLGNDWSPPEEATWDTIVSLDSMTEAWTRKTFITSDASDISPTDYVTANPYSVEAHESPHISHLDEIWRYGWDQQLGTVPPRVVTDRTIQQYRSNDKRVMAHYLQPHMPPLKRENGELKAGLTQEDSSADPKLERETDNIGQNFRHPQSDEASFFDRLPGQWDFLNGEPTGVFQRLRYGELEHETVWKAYRDTLLVVLDEITTLLRAVDAEMVVITSDHGNAFGEWGFFGHPMHMPFSVLREVPFVTTSATAEINYTPPEYDTQDTADQDERLEALGYK